jgi:hypothetical protein
MMASSSLDWQQYLAYAREICGEESSEACLRTVMSRAYYAAYWKARRRVEKKGITIPKTNAHEAVWDEYASIKNSTFTPIREIGIRLKTKRAWADYESAPSVTHKDAETTLEDAAELIGDMEEIIRKERADASQ